MDRISKSAVRLWGEVGETGELRGFPSFAQELERRASGDLSIQSTRVSKWSIGHQLEHLYRSSHYCLDRIEEALTGANAADHMGFWGVGLMIGGFIPRHVFPTIPPLQPQSGTLTHIDPLRATLTDRLEKIAWDLESIKLSAGKSRHPRMKYLTAGQWIFFADIHHRHHLAIMRDILSASGRSGSAIPKGSRSTKTLVASNK